MKRYCPQCKVRFVNTSTCDPQRFERRMKRNEEKAAIRLKKVEDEMYGYERPIYKKPQEFKLADLPASGDQAILGGGGKNKGRGKGAKGDDSEEEGGVDTDPAGRALRRKENNPPKQVMKKAGEVEVALPMKKRTNGANAEAKETVLLDKGGGSLSGALAPISLIEQRQGSAINGVVAQTEERVKSADEFKRRLRHLGRLEASSRWRLCLCLRVRSRCLSAWQFSRLEGASLLAPRVEQEEQQTHQWWWWWWCCQLPRRALACPCDEGRCQGDKFDLLLA